MFGKSHRYEEAPEHYGRSERSSNMHEWIDLIVHFFSSTLGSIGKSFAESIQQKMRAAVAMLLRGIFAILLCIVGLVFMLVGLAQAIGAFMGLGDSVGYIIVGAMAVLVGLLVSADKKE